MISEFTAKKKNKVYYICKLPKDFVLLPMSIRNSFDAPTPLFDVGVEYFKNYRWLLDLLNMQNKYGSNMYLVYDDTDYYLTTMPDYEIANTFEQTNGYPITTEWLYSKLITVTPFAGKYYKDLYKSGVNINWKLNDAIMYPITVRKKKHNTDIRNQINILRDKFGNLKFCIDRYEYMDKYQFMAEFDNRTVPSDIMEYLRYGDRNINYNTPDGYSFNWKSTIDGYFKNRVREGRDIKDRDIYDSLSYMFRMYYDDSFIAQYATIDEKPFLLQCNYDGKEKLVIHYNYYNEDFRVIVHVKRNIYKIVHEKTGQTIIELNDYNRFTEFFIRAFGLYNRYVLNDFTAKAFSAAEVKIINDYAHTEKREIYDSIINKIAERQKPDCDIMDFANALRLYQLMSTASVHDTLILFKGKDRDSNSNSNKNINNRKFIKTTLLLPTAFVESGRNCKDIELIKCYKGTKALPVLFSSYQMGEAVVLLQADYKVKQLYLENSESRRKKHFQMEYADLEQLLPLPINTKGNFLLSLINMIETDSIISEMVYIKRVKENTIYFNSLGNTQQNENFRFLNFSITLTKEQIQFHGIEEYTVPINELSKREIKETIIYSIKQYLKYIVSNVQLFDNYYVNDSVKRVRNFMLTFKNYLNIYGISFKDIDIANQYIVFTDEVRLYFWDNQGMIVANIYENGSSQNDFKARIEGGTHIKLEDTLNKILENLVYSYKLHYGVMLKNIINTLNNYEAYDRYVLRNINQGTYAIEDTTISNNIDSKKEGLLIFKDDIGGLRMKGNKSLNNFLRVCDNYGENVKKVYNRLQKH